MFCNVYDEMFCGLGVKIIFRKVIGTDWMVYSRIYTTPWSMSLVGTKPGNPEIFLIFEFVSGSAPGS